jgi:hypothetical protein
MSLLSDRRRVHQFSVHNLLVDEWYPILGDAGYVLYSFYVRLANRRDERAFPGFKLIRRHFGYGRATIWNYNRLLVWCSLISIVPGNEFNPNQYFILEVPKCDEEARAVLCRRARAELDVGKRHEAKFLALVLRRVEGWKPIQHWWELKGREKVITVTRAQLELDLAGEGGVVLQENHPSSEGEPPRFSGETTPVLEENHPGSAGEPEQSERNNPKEQSERDNPQQQGAVDAEIPKSVLLGLSHRGVEEDAARRLVGDCGLDVVKRQLLYFSHRLTDYWKRGHKVESESGLLVNSIKGDWSAPSGWIDAMAGCEKYEEAEVVGDGET